VQAAGILEFDLAAQAGGQTALGGIDGDLLPVRRTGARRAPVRGCRRAAPSPPRPRARPVARARTASASAAAYGDAGGGQLAWRRPPSKIGSDSAGPIDQVLRFTPRP
jgi:hypothetical protein